ncbi:MAG: hypothetical protein IJ733_07045 [Lachnospiraceae bacterium]|nr:hypothetical protein [Lachnospiraceae bacterium]
MRTFLDDAWEKGLMERLIRQIYKKMLRGQEPAQIAEDLVEEETVIREIYDIINRSLPDFDSEKVYQELKKEKAVV